MVEVEVKGLVVAYVGFRAAYDRPGGLDPALAGLCGGTLATWATFAPSLFMVFLVAPWVDRLPRYPQARAALSAVSAAATGAIASLAAKLLLATAFAPLDAAVSGPPRRRPPLPPARRARIVARMDAPTAPRPADDAPVDGDATSLKALAPPRRSSGLLSLFLTGMADVWSAARSGVAKRGDLAGLLCMVLSAFSFALMAACVKLFLPTVPTGRTVFWRGAVMALAFFAIAALRGVSVRGTRHGKLVLRGLLGAGAVSCYFWSVQHVSIGDAVLIQYSHPVFVAVLAPLLLREKTGRGHWLWVLAAFAGVWIVVRYGVGGGGKGGSSDALVGLVGSLLSGCAYMTVRDLARTENAWTILVWFSATMVPVAAAHAAYEGVSLVPADAAEAGGHLAMIAAGLVGQFALTQGLSRAGAARATAVSMSGPVFGLALDYAFFGLAPGPASLLGTAVVVAALTLLAVNRPKT